MNQETELLTEAMGLLRQAAGFTDSPLYDEINHFLDIHRREKRLGTLKAYRSEDKPIVDRLNQLLKDMEELRKGSHE